MADRIKDCGTLTIGIVERRLEWNGTTFVDVGNPDQLFVCDDDNRCDCEDDCANAKCKCTFASWPLPPDWRACLLWRVN
jgi:hypothetical protein